MKEPNTTDGMAATVCDEAQQCCVNLVSLFFLVVSFNGQWIYYAGHQFENLSESSMIGKQNSCLVLAAWNLEEGGYRI